MHSLDGEPAGVAVPTESDPTTLRDFLMQTVGKLVDEYVLKFVEVNRMHETGDESSQSGLETSDQDDRVTNYASLVIGYGLMAENFHDAWREGDGGRLVRCWKFLLLHFRGNGRTKYALEAFRLISQTSAVLSPRSAHQLTWNRTCNPKGGHGNNIPLDLENEFLNRVFKDDINTFRANITTKSVDRSSQSLKRMNDTLENFDRMTHVHRDSGRHVLPYTLGDFCLILDVNKCLYQCQADSTVCSRTLMLTLF